MTATPFGAIAMPANFADALIAGTFVATSTQSNEGSDISRRRSPWMCSPSVIVWPLTVT